MRKNAFRDACRGIQDTYRSERNARIHFFATTVVVAAGVWFEISLFEWSVVLLASTVVLVTEMLNTALERLCDHVHPDRHEMIRQVKDIAAGAVLISVVIAVVLGVMVFYPHIENVL